MAPSNRERVFVEEYLQCWNATEAARRAGYKNPNKIGPRKLVEIGTKRHIERRISELKATTDEVLLRLASHSRGTMDDFVNGESLDIDRARERGKMHLIKKFKLTTTTVSRPDGSDIETHQMEVELYDAQAATVQLGKLLGLYVERVEVTHNWRAEAAEIGLDPDSLVDELFFKVKRDAGADSG